MTQNQLKSQLFNYNVPFGKFKNSDWRVQPWIKTD